MAACLFQNDQFSLLTGVESIFITCGHASFRVACSDCQCNKRLYSPGAEGLDLDPNDKVFFFADSGSPGGPN